VTRARRWTRVMGLLALVAALTLPAVACSGAEPAVQAAPAAPTALVRSPLSGAGAPVGGTDIAAPAHPSEETGPASAAPEPGVGPDPEAPGGWTVPPPPLSPTAVAPLGEGWRVLIPDIGVDAAMVSVGYDADGAMGAPEGPDEVGWFRYGVAPGKAGNALLDGHVDWTDRRTNQPRTGVFWNLARLRLGSHITVVSGGRKFVYAVAEKRRYRWDDPEGVAVLQPSADARITLITCGGVFDRTTRNYSMRDVVIAHLVS